MSAGSELMKRRLRARSRRSLEARCAIAGQVRGVCPAAAFVCVEQLLLLLLLQVFRVKAAL